MDEYIERERLRKALYDADEITFDGLDIIDNFPAADVMTRDEGIRLGAELAAMHGSDATSQDLEKEYWRGFEDAMQKRDVQPVKHGRWIPRILPLNKAGNECSVCLAISVGAMKPYYCPNCGAKMDGET